MTRPARTVREVLIAAKWLLEHIGWCQKHFELRHRGKPVAFCAVGAIQSVNAKSALRLSVLWIDVMQNIVDFNDAPSTTLPMVLARFDEAIARAE
jgi:hypothetical protein